MTFGLTDEAMALILHVFRNHTEIAEARIFGSRALGTFAHNSDIDIALYGSINFSLLARISSELDELPLPYKFDVLVYDRITHPPLKDHIDTHGQPIYKSPAKS